MKVTHTFNAFLLPLPSTPLYVYVFICVIFFAAEEESEASSEEEFELTVVTQPAENVSISTDLQTNREQSLKLTS